MVIFNSYFSLPEGTWLCSFCMEVADRWEPCWWQHIPYELFGEPVAATNWGIFGCTFSYSISHLCPQSFSLSTSTTSIFFLRYTCQTKISVTPNSDMTSPNEVYIPLWNLLTPSNSLSELLSIRVISINWSTSHLRLPISSHLFLLRFVWKSDTPKIQRPIIFVPIKTAIWRCTSIFRKKNNHSMTHFSLMPQGCAWTTSCAGISIICWELLFVWSWAIHPTKGGTLWHFWGWKQSHQTKSGGKIQIVDARRGNSREREWGRGGAQLARKPSLSERICARLVYATPQCFLQVDVVGGKQLFQMKLPTR